MPDVSQTKIMGERCGYGEGDFLFEGGLLARCKKELVRAHGKVGVEEDL